ncbi:UNVERIFIED_CONTAM: hypothetical protein K2H54_021229 [Gekko kuhli]
MEEVEEACAEEGEAPEEEEAAELEAEEDEGSQQQATVEGPPSSSRAGPTSPSLVPQGKRTVVGSSHPRKETLARKSTQPLLESRCLGTLQTIESKLKDIRKRQRKQDRDVAQIKQHLKLQ